MTTYTVVGLIRRKTGVLEIAEIFAEELTYPIRPYETADAVGWVRHIDAEDRQQAATYAQYLHKYDGIPVMRPAGDLTLGTLIVDKADRGRRVVALTRDGDDVLTWLDGLRHRPKRYPASQELRVVIHKP